jgi:hypothetical protein
MIDRAFKTSKWRIDSFSATIHAVIGTSEGPRKNPGEYVRVILKETSTTDLDACMPLFQGPASHGSFDPARLPGCANASCMPVRGAV